MVEIPQEYYELAKRNIESNPILLELFDKDWIYSLFEEKDSDDQHDLFWTLIDGKKYDLFVSKLVSVKTLPNLKSLINKLVGQFDSAISELEVLSFYRAKYPGKVEYEPKIEDRDGGPDIKLSLEGVDYYIEILTILESKIERKIDTIHKVIEKRLNSIDNNPFILAFGTELEFKEENIGPFIDYVNTILLNSEKIKLNDTYNFFLNGKRLAHIRFFSKAKNGGYVAGTVTSGIPIESAGRIKFRVLDKLDKEQLPKNTKNILVINLSSLINPELAFSWACLGQDCIHIELDSGEFVGGVKPNGIFHDKRSEIISAIIGYKDNDYSRRVALVNPKAINQIELETINTYF